MVSNIISMLWSPNRSNTVNFIPFPLIYGCNNGQTWITYAKGVYQPWLLDVPTLSLVAQDHWQMVHTKNIFETILVWTMDIVSQDQKWCKVSCRLVQILMKCYSIVGGTSLKLLIGLYGILWYHQPGRYTIIWCIVIILPYPEQVLVHQNRMVHTGR